MFVQRLDHRVARVVDLVAAEVGGAVDEPVAQGVDAVRHLLDEAGQAVDELADDERENADEDRQPEDHHECHGAGACGAVAIEEVDGGQEHRRQHQGQGDGYHDESEAA